MDPIPVPAPPREAYNQNRRVSDLLLSQVKHFQHIELKRGDLGIAPELARGVYTEAGAARYIAAMTNALRGAASSLPAQLAVAAAPAKKPLATIPGVPLPPGKGKKVARKRPAAKQTQRKK
jgi:hypothetical protein